MQHDRFDNFTLINKTNGLGDFIELCSNFQKNVSDSFFTTTRCRL